MHLARIQRRRKPNERDSIPIRCARGARSAAEDALPPCARQHACRPAPPAPDQPCPAQPAPSTPCMCGVPSLPPGSEPLLLDLLLGSGHRTLDPEEADFFFVPTLTTCWFHPIAGAQPACARRPACPAFAWPAGGGARGGWGSARPLPNAPRLAGGAATHSACASACAACATRARAVSARTHHMPAPPLPLAPTGWADHPWWYVDSWSRVKHAVTFTAELLAWVKSTHPFWNRTGGSDHIWHFAHDEGACWAPAEVYKSSIILTHWGRMDGAPASQTTYQPVRRRRGGAGSGEAWGATLLATPGSTYSLLLRPGDSLAARAPRTHAANARRAAPGGAPTAAAGQLHCRCPGRPLPA